MNALTETAEREAEEAEAENEDQENADQLEEEAAPPEQPAEPPASQMTEQEAEREFKKLESAAQTYLKKAMPITEKLGMPVQACPLCTFPGLAIPRAEHEVTSDVEAAVLALIGKSQPPAFKASPQYERCSECDGWGDVLTGAQKDVSRTAQCLSCGGKGFKQVIAATVIGNGTTPQTFPGAQVPYTPIPGGVPDAWGRPAGHVHWGIDPASVGV